MLFEEEAVDVVVIAVAIVLTKLTATPQTLSVLFIKSRSLKPMKLVFLSLLSKHTTRIRMTIRIMLTCCFREWKGWP